MSSRPKDQIQKKTATIQVKENGKTNLKIIIHYLSARFYFLGLIDNMDDKHDDSRKIHCMFAHALLTDRFWCHRTHRSSAR